MFCVECGLEGDLIGVLCEKCYSEKRVWAKLPVHVDLTSCAHCSRFLIDDNWYAIDSVRDAIQRMIESSLTVPKGAKASSVKVSLDERDQRNLDAEVEVEISVEGRIFHKSVHTTVRLKGGSCMTCSKQQGNYFEAVLQVRGDERTMDERTLERIQKVVAERVSTMRKTNASAFVSRVENVRGGLDFYFGTIPSARILARELQDSLCADYKESNSLWGRRGGKEIYRMTFLVRIPSFVPGDIIEFESKDYFVRGMAKGHLRLTDLVTGEELATKLNAPVPAHNVYPASRISSAVVLLETECDIQVLDPVTMATLELRKPKEFSRRGEQIRIVKTNLGTYVLGDEW
jgi:nonsense-mediated mRNA decay protein 3